MDPAQTAQLSAMTREERRQELERLMLALWGSTVAARLVEALDVGNSTARDWLKGNSSVPTHVLLLLRLWAEEAPQRETEHNLAQAAEGLTQAAQALARLIAAK